MNPSATVRPLLRAAPFALACLALGLLLLPAPALRAAAPATKEPEAKKAAKPKPAGPRGPVRGERMDYGPFVSCSVLRPRAQGGAAGPKANGAAGRHPAPLKSDGGEVLAVKGIVIRVGNDAAVCFDTDLLGVVGGWTGGWLDLRQTNLGDYKGDFPPRAKGTLQFGTNDDPGWPRNGFADPRAGRQGPLPADWAHFKGLYRDGRRVVLSYTVGKSEVLEMEGSAAAAGGNVAFTRTLRVGPLAAPQALVACELDGARGDVRPLSAPGGTAKRGPAVGHVAVLARGGACTAVGAVNPPAGATLEVVDDFRVQLNLPAGAAPAAFKLVVASLPEASVGDFAKLLAAAGDVEDLPALCRGGTGLWPEPLVTVGKRGSNAAAYAVDTVTLPDDNPWKSWMRVGGFDFFRDGRAAVCTFSGDVWIVSGLDDALGHVAWKRFAAGLYEPLGLKIVDDQIYVLGRDRITRLHDLNGDGEADFYENFCSAWTASPIYHAFAMDLQADAEGNFYYTNCGNQAPFDLRANKSYGVMMKVSRYGQTCRPYADGLRAPNGGGIGPRGEVVCSDNQGHWTPVDRINLVKPGGFYGFYADPRRVKAPELPKLRLPAHYDPPLCWIRYPEPDNSAGGLVWAGPKWGPLSDHLLCTSYGKSALLGVLWEEVGGVAQGGVYKLPLKFDAGIMRARVNPADGQVWVAGLKGWQTNARHDGCLQRVRYTGKPAHVPVALHVLPAGLSITFSDPLDPATAKDEQSYGISQWNYRWTSTYGSPEYKVSDPKATGHDEVPIKSVALSPDGKTVTLATPPLRPVMQMVIEMHLTAADGAPVNWEIDNTINQVPGK